MKQWTKYNNNTSTNNYNYNDIDNNNGNNNRGNSSGRGRWFISRAKNTSTETASGHFSLPSILISPLWKKATRISIAYTLRYVFSKGRESKTHVPYNFELYE